MSCTFPLHVQAPFSWHSRPPLLNSCVFPSGVVSHSAGMQLQQGIGVLLNSQLAGFQFNRSPEEVVPALPSRPLTCTASAQSLRPSRRACCSRRPGPSGRRGSSGLWGSRTRNSSPHTAAVVLWKGSFRRLAFALPVTIIVFPKLTLYTQPVAPVQLPPLVVIVWEHGEGTQRSQ